MLRNIQRLDPFQRRLIFFLIFGGILMAIVGLTVLLIGSSLNSARQMATTLVEGVTVREFALLPDDDAYPASVTVLGDSVYTGSYVSGALWRIAQDGTVTEVAGSREAIGAVAGLAAAPDGSVFIVDQWDTDTRSGGGDVKRLAPDGSIDVFTDLSGEGGFVAPDDVTLDAQGRVYVSDRGRDEVWRFDADGSAALFWALPADNGPVQTAVTGLAYDPAADAIIITEPERNVIYRVPVGGGEAEVLYQHPLDAQYPPGFDGVTVSPDGVIYVAALGQNGIARVENGLLTYLAGQFRGASDVATADGARLYVSNWDQSALALPLVQPRLPFALDVIELSAN